MITTPYDKFTADLGDGLSEGEYYHWQAIKRNENLVHRAAGHTNFCPSCFNCLCGSLVKRFVCICGEGKIWTTPYRIRMRGVRG